jgi:hypothetical protein
MKGDRMMIFIANVSTPQQTYNVHLEVGDDDAGRAKVAEALSDIQQRFLPRAEQPKKPAAPPRAAAGAARTTQPQPGGEANRDK